VLIPTDMKPLKTCQMNRNPSTIHVGHTAIHCDLPRGMSPRTHTPGNMIKYAPGFPRLRRWRSL
jgi:hypothetical protein